MSIDIPSGRPAAIETPAPGDPRIARLSLNTKTVNSLDFPAAIEVAQRAGLGAIGAWREPVQQYGVDKAAALVKSSGVRVSSLCRGGFFTTADPDEHTRAIADNRRALDEAAALGAPCLVMVVGGLPAGDRDLVAARQRMADCVGELVPYALEVGVQIALEPMHPIFTADRGVLATLGQALDIAEAYAAEAVGVVVDTYHVWWDPDAARQIARAGAQGRISSYQVCDWILPLAADALLSRGMMGDGFIDFPAWGREVTAAGYTGDVEVEIFNADVWAADPAAVVDTMKRRYVTEVLPGL